MFNKTTKLGFALLIATVFLAGCASTSQPTDTSVTDTGTGTSGASTSGVTSSTVNGSAGDQAASLATVFYFDFDQSALSDEMRALLIAHSADIKAYPRNIRLEGHADERGTREYNIALGERRANAVRDYLRLQGVNTPIEVISYGEEKPASSGGFDAAWALDRRVELK